MYDKQHTTTHEMKVAALAWLILAGVGIVLANVFAAML